MLLTFAAITVIAAFSVVGALLARRSGKPDALLVLYATFAVVSQIAAAKIAQFDFGFFEVSAPAGVVSIAVTFLLTDVVNERFGRAAVHRMIFITLLSQIAMAAMLGLTEWMPAAPFWEGQDAWSLLLGVVPRITLASWVTFLISENLDAWLYQAFRRATKDRHLWLRNVGSSLISLTVDTLTFVTLAFWGTGMPLGQIMVGQFTVKYAVALLSIPFMYLCRFAMGSSNPPPVSTQNEG